MTIEYGKVKGLDGYIFIERKGTVASSIHTFFCKFMDVKFCKEYLSNLGFKKFVNKRTISLKELKVLEPSIEKLSPFKLKVYKTLMKTKAGQKITYSELAKKSGNPFSFRAVATAMSSNSLPILIPCHRVLSKNGVEHYSISCFKERPSLCTVKTKQGIKDCARKIKLRIRDLEIE